MSDNWRPSASLSTLRRRAELLQEIRRFFEIRNILEVDTPTLSIAGNPDPNLASFSSFYCTPGIQQRLYLHTSPELAMKRLLAAGSGPIYQICKVFRNGEHGRFHNAEFTLLEWYRPGFDHHQLMTEMDDLFQALLQTPGAERVTYQEIVQRHAQIDPHLASISELRARTAEDGIVPNLDELDRDGWLDLLFSQLVAPHLGKAGRPTFVYDYPASQAALARIRPGIVPLAERFEVYLAGIELANGFHELGDAAEQRQRFAHQLSTRRQRGLAPIPLDEKFLAALELGFPDCAGVALGIDRLLMIRIGATNIEEVLAFPRTRA